MKILVDMNLSPAWIPFLVAEGIDAIHWASVGDPRAPDRDLMLWAHAAGYVVFTHDLDFSALLAITGDVGPSVFQIRTLDLVPSAMGLDVVRVLRQYAAELEAGAIIPLDSATARVRILPIHRG